MNNMRVIICATFALLVAALVYFYINSGSQSASEDRTLKELKNELAQIQAQVYLNQDRKNTPSPTTATPNSSFDAISALSDEEKKVMEEAEINRLADEIEHQRLAEEKAKEDDLLADNLPAVNDARLQLINQALVMATVKEFDAPSFITVLDIKRPENVTPGLILGIRRQNGIIGRVQVASIDNGQAIADAIPASFFNKPVEIQVGDELIVVP